jgi:hypothetical protein
MIYVFFFLKKKRNVVTLNVNSTDNRKDNDLLFDRQVNQNPHVNVSTHEINEQIIIMSTHRSMNHI